MERYILDCPLVSIGGLVTREWSITLFMHKGFDRMNAIESFCMGMYKRAVEGIIGEGLWHIWGDLDNPYFQWPIYAELIPKNKNGQIDGTQQTLHGASITR